MYGDKESIEAKLTELEEVGGSELLSDLFKLYFECIEDKKIQLVTALNENKFDKIYFVAHSLKSTCGNLGSTILFQKVIDLETAAKNNFDVSTKPKIESLLKIVLTEVDLFSAYIAEKDQIIKSAA
jgi:HPt (histidine-containing phosphotransfer) domain-containing protein